MQQIPKAASSEKCNIWTKFALYISFIARVLNATIEFFYVPRSWGTVAHHCQTLRKHVCCPCCSSCTTLDYRPFIQILKFDFVVDANIPAHQVSSSIPSVSSISSVGIFSFFSFKLILWNAICVRAVFLNKVLLRNALL